MISLTRRDQCKVFLIRMSMFRLTKEIELFSSSLIKATNTSRQPVDDGKALRNRAETESNRRECIWQLNLPQIWYRSRFHKWPARYCQWLDCRDSGLEQKVACLSPLSFFEYLDDNDVWALVRVCRRWRAALWHFRIREHFRQRRRIQQRNGNV